MVALNGATHNNVPQFYLLGFKDKVVAPVLN